MPGGVGGGVGDDPAYPIQSHAAITMRRFRHETGSVEDLPQTPLGKEGSRLAPWPRWKAGAGNPRRSTGSHEVDATLA